MGTDTIFATIPAVLLALPGILFAIAFVPSTMGRTTTIARTRTTGLARGRLGQLGRFSHEILWQRLG